MSVPVLSEQITDTLPSVSTAGSLRIIAPFGHLGYAYGQRDRQRRRQTLRDSPNRQSYRRHEHIKDGLTSYEADDKSGRSKGQDRIEQDMAEPGNLRVSGVSNASVVEISSEMRPTSVRSPMATTMPEP